MANQIVLAWTVDVTNTSLGPAGAMAALMAVPLYVDPVTDPVLGQLFGLTRASDVGTTGATTATRTLTLNMTALGAGVPPFAPPPFPCRPITSTPPVLPYPLREAVTLPGSFFPSSGSTVVPTTMTQIPSLVTGSVIQFLSQEGVFYTVAAGTTSTLINLTTPYTGSTGNTGAFKEVAAPVTLAAIYSTSDHDTAGVATVPAIPAGSGARTVHVIYKDSLGAAFTVTATLTGRRPAAVLLTGGNKDMSEITNIVIVTTGGFKNSVGELTLVELSSALPPIPANATPGTGIGAAQGDRTFFALTDEAQLLIGRHLAYLPPSYFSLAQQGASAPQLVGDFLVTTGSKNVPTTVDQTAATPPLAATNVIEFASQPGTLYTVAAVTPKIVTLTTAYSGIDENFTGAHNVNSNLGTKGNLGTEVIEKRTGATIISPSPAAPPTNAQLAAVLGQFVDPGNAAPPPKPPLSPATMTPPVTVGGAVPFLSGLFTQTLQLALAGVPITPQPITFI
jgi:hypothetical protein